MENINCETSLTRNETFLILLKSVLAILQCKVNTANIALVLISLKYVLKICGLNVEIVAVTRPSIRLFSFR